MNYISGIHSFLGQNEYKALVNTFVYSNFNYWSFVWYFSIKKSTNEIEKMQERSLKLFYYNATDTYVGLFKFLAAFYRN